MSKPQEVLTLAELRLSGRPMSVLELLEAHVKGLHDLTPTQVQAARIYLAKTQADLKAIEVTGEVSANVTVTRIVRRVVASGAASDSAASDPATDPA